MQKHYDCDYDYDCDRKNKVHAPSLRVLKTSLWDPRCETYVFKSRITQEIQIWVQNNQIVATQSCFFQKIVLVQKKSDIFSIEFDCRPF